MAEVRGANGNVEAITEWIKTWRVYCKAPDPRTSSYRDPQERWAEERTSRYGYVEQIMQLTRKQVKRRLKNYRQWIANVQAKKVPFPEGLGVTLDELLKIKDPTLQVRKAASSAAARSSGNRTRSVHLTRGRVQYR